jgi:hypothetical protein
MYNDDHHSASPTTYIDDDHLNVADDEHSISARLSDVDVTIGYSDGSSPAAVKSLGSAHVILQQF